MMYNSHSDDKDAGQSPVFLSSRRLQNEVPPSKGSNMMVTLSLIACSKPDFMLTTRRYAFAEAGAQIRQADIHEYRTGKPQPSAR